MSLGNDSSLKEVLDTFELVNSRLIDRGGSRTITPGTSNQTLAKGNYKGDITVVGDANLKEENILSGINLFGVVGNANSLKYATGVINSSGRTMSFNTFGKYTNNTTYVDIVVGFKPKVLVVYNKTFIGYMSVLVPYSFRDKTPAVFSYNYKDDAQYGNETSVYTSKADALVFISSTTVRLPLYPVNTSTSSPHEWYAFG